MAQDAKEPIAPAREAALTPLGKMYKNPVTKPDRAGVTASWFS